MIKKTQILLIVLSVCWFGALAQTKVHVVTRTILKTFDYKPSASLLINGEKASINILPSADNKIRVKVMLVSKNPQLAYAEEDLKYCDLNIVTDKNKIELANNFTDKPGFKPITSNLSARYEIEVPDNTNLNIRNVYGEIDIRNLNALITINSSYGQLFVGNIAGFAKITSYYCDIKGDALNSNINIAAQQADIALKGINNDCSVSNKYGSINLEMGGSKFTNLTGNMTKINVSVEKIENHTMYLETTNGEIIVPDAYTKYLSMKDNSGKFIYSNGKSILKTKTNYNSITLNIR